MSSEYVSVHTVHLRYFGGRKYGFLNFLFIIFDIIPFRNLIAVSDHKLIGL